MNRFPIPADQPYSYTQRFSREHLGIDIMAPLGTPVVAVEDGVAWPATEPKGGKVVYLEAPGRGVLTRATRYFYGHLSAWPPLLQFAQVPVMAGDVLGFVGNTGNAANGPAHLHFQIREGSLVVDPYEPLQAVDPFPERGTPGDTVSPPEIQWPTLSLVPNIGAPLCLLALIWLYSKGGRS